MEEMTPVLTAVYRGSGDGGESSVQMACIRAFDSSTVSEDNKDPGGDESPPNGAFGVRLSGHGGCTWIRCSCGSIDLPIWMIVSQPHVSRVTRVKFGHVYRSVLYRTQSPLDELPFFRTGHCHFLHSIS